MRSKKTWVGIAAVLLLMCSAVVAQEGDHDRDMRLSGFINDHSPASVNPAGPWEIRGTWSLSIDDETGTATFTADLAMERSDYWIVTSSDPAGNADSATARSPHTHHISMSNAKVTMSNGTLEVTGPAYVTGNGSPVFNGAASTLTIDVTGGTSIPYSNITLMFGLPAQGHFGSNPIHGSVKVRN